MEEVVNYGLHWKSEQIGTRSKKVMLAVLPFENLTGDPNKEYLAVSP